MSLLLKVLGGAMAGLGKGMVEQAKLDWETAQKEIMFRREVALKNLGFQQSKVLKDIEQGDALERIDRTGEQQRKTQSEGTLQEDWKADRQVKRTTAANKELKAVDFQYDVKAKKLAAKLGLIQDDFNAKLQAGEIVQDADGGYHLVDKRSAKAKPVGVTGPVKSADDGLVLPTRSGSTKPQGEQRTQAARPDAAFTTRYANATPEKAPGLFRNGQKVPLEEAWRQYQGN